MNSSKIIALSIILALIIIVILRILYRTPCKKIQHHEENPIVCKRDHRKIYGYVSDTPDDVPCPTCLLVNDRIPFDTASSGQDQFFTLAVQSTGQIIVANQTMLFRYNADGTLDSSFGTAGVANMPIFPFNDLFRIRVGAGDVIYVAALGYDVNIVRFTANGILDTSFAGNGHFDGGTNNTSNAAGVIDIYVYADNSILASRLVDQTVYKITSSGVYDPLFTPITFSIPSYTIRRLTNVVAYEDKIFIFGFIRDGSFNEWPFIARANFDGTIDTGFGTSGYLIIQPADLGLSYLAVETYGGSIVNPDNGDLYWVGSIDNIGDSDYFIGIIKLSQDGIIDTAYGVSGAVINDRADLSLPYQYSESYGNSHILSCDGGLVMSVLNYSDVNFTYLWRVDVNGVTISQDVEDMNSEILYWECTPDGNGNLIVTGEDQLLGEPILRSFPCAQLDYIVPDNAV
tara:strand:+ start:131839 stop:133209 length:1371 start_codon:yes stop_codon:yes gene_type:complete